MIYQVTDEELRSFHGTTLKIFIVLNNSPNGMTAAELIGETNESRSSVYRALDLCLKMGQISQNGTQYVSKWDKNPKLGLEKERTKEKENISSKNLKEEEEGARTREEKEVDFISAILDNNAQLEALLMTCHLPPQADLQSYFRPFAERFKTDLEASGEDLYLLDRKSAKYRFKCWFTKHYKDNDYKTANTSRALDPEPDISAYNIKWD